MRNFCAPPVMPAFDTSAGKMRPRLTWHFVDRYRQRFPLIEPGKDFTAHVARCMLASKVIHGLQGADRSDFFLWHEPSDRILVMKDYMGILVTCYTASKSEWFKRLGVLTMDLPTFGEVFGTLDERTPPQVKLNKIKTERERQEELKYLEWYEDKAR